jgi:TolB protein
MSVHGNTEIYVIDHTGNILRRCTSNDSEDVSPAWSPDGSQIAFVSDRSGGPQIYLMNSDCSGQTRVTFAGGYNTSPDWSPQGDRIAFTGRDSAGSFDVFTVEPHSNYIERLTQDQGDNREASWSPDGRYLVYTSTRGGSGGALYIMTEDGQYQTEILSGGYETPAWER